MKTSEILRNSVSVLKDKGWNQGDLEGDNGSVCVMGAINVSSVHRMADFAKACDVLGSVVEDNYSIPKKVVDNPFQMHSAAYANDYLMTSVDEPIAMLEKAAIMAEENGN